ncbi:hypothetical protein K1719_038321 [Acacia pycnantha]|nr:hypothetical protein K1719_038321 [Acacia pycnantha]
MAITVNWCKPSPFLGHKFATRSKTGWMPRHIIAKDEDDKVIGVVPHSHSILKVLCEVLHVLSCAEIL